MALVKFGEKISQENLLVCMWGKKTSVYFVSSVWLHKLKSDLGKKKQICVFMNIKIYIWNYNQRPRVFCFSFWIRLFKIIFSFSCVVKTWSIPKYENNCYGNSFLCWHNWTLAWKWGWLNSWHRFFQSCAQRNWRKFTVSIIPPLVPYRVLIRKKDWLFLF